MRLPSELRSIMGGNVGLKVSGTISIEERAALVSEN
jgi:hypothetical protein